MYRLATAIIIMAALSTATVKAQQTSQTRTIVNNMMDAIKKAKGYAYVMRGSEKLIGKKEFKVTDLYTKINNSPRKLYGRVENEPNKGTQMLYVESEREGKILVKAGRFIPSIKLSPFSGLLTKDQHHTLLSAGFMFVWKVINDGIKRAESQNGFDQVFKYVGDVTFGGKKCYKIVIEDPTYAITTYTAKKGETLYAIAQKLLVPEYNIMEMNGLKGFDEDLSGKVLKVPTSYAKKSVLFIDKETNYPIYQEMGDNNGVFEKYEYSNLVINPVFAADEFTTDCKDYSF
jgi:LysM repeat protein/predicted RNA-binding protein YlqC (UPF0109 family)